MDLSIIFTVISILTLIGSSLASNGVPGRIPILMMDTLLTRANVIPDAGLKRSYGLMNHWNCRFETDFCGLTNAYNMDQFQRHSDRFRPMFAETSMLYINSSIARNFQAARLESDYFTADSESFGCLSLRYLMYGTGAAKLYVIQQDIRNKCIWSETNADYSGQWREAQMTIDLRDGGSRFFIEAHVNSRPPNDGTIAISRIGFHYGVCPFSQTNNCQPQQQSTPIPPEPSPA